MIKYRLMIGAFLIACSGSAMSQISTAASDSDMKPFFDKANACLTNFDKTAKSKKISSDSYKSAIEGVCVTEISGLRGLYSLHLERSSNQDYLVARLDQNIKDAKAAMVSAYIMK